MDSGSNPVKDDTAEKTSLPINSQEALTLGDDGVFVTVEDGEPSVGSSPSYKNTVRKIRETVSETFGATKRELMSRLERERQRESEHNTELARKYENELKLLSECQLDELENVNVAIKCEIQTVQTRFGIKALSDLVARTNEELMRENLAKLREMSLEFERSHKTEMEHLHLMYKEILFLQLNRSNDINRNHMKRKPFTPRIWHNAIKTFDQIRVLEEKLESIEIETTKKMQDLMNQHREELEMTAQKTARIQEYRVEEEQELEETSLSNDRTLTRDLVSSSGDSGYWQCLSSPTRKTVVVEKDSQTDKDLDEAHESEIRSRLEEEYRSRLEVIHIEHSKEIKSREEELKQLRDRYELDVSQLRETFESEKLDLHDRLERRVSTSTKVESELSDTLDGENDDFLKEYEKKLMAQDEADGRLQELRDLLEDRDSTIAELKNQLDKIKEDNSRSVAELEVEMTRSHETETNKVKKQLEKLREELYEETVERSEERSRLEEVIKGLKAASGDRETGLRREVEELEGLVARLREAGAADEAEKQRLSKKLQERSEDFASSNYALEETRKELQVEREAQQKLLAQMKEQEGFAKKLEEMERKLQNREKELNERNLELANELQEERETGAQLTDMNQRLQVQNNVNEKEIARLTDQLSQVSGELELLQGERGRRQVREEVYEEVLEEVREDLEQRLRSEHEQELEQLNQQLAQARSDEEQTKLTLNDVEFQISELQQSYEDALSDKELLETQVNDQLIEISSLKSRLEEMKLKSDNNQSTTNMERIAALQRQTEQSEEELNRKTREITELKDQILKLKQKISEQSEEFRVATQNETAQKEQLEMEISSQENYLREKEILIINLQTTIKNLSHDLDLINQEKSEIQQSKADDMKKLNEDKDEVDRHYRESTEIIELKLSQKAHEFSLLQKEVNFFKEENTELLQKILSLEEELKKLKAELNEKDSLNTSLLQKITDIETETTQTKLKISQQIDEFESMKQNISELESSLAEKGLNVEKLENLLDEYKNKMAHKQSLAEKDSELQKSKEKGELEESERIEKLELELSTMKKKLKNLEEELQRKIEELNEKENSIVKLDYDLQEKELELESQKKIHQTVILEFNSKKEECQDHLKDLSEAQDELDKLKDQLRELEEEAEALREGKDQIKASHETRLQELRSTIEVEWQTKLTSILQRHAQELKEAEELNKNKQNHLEKEYKNKISNLEQSRVDEDDQRRQMEERGEADLESKKRELERKFEEELEVEQKRLRLEIGESYERELKKARKYMKNENDEIWIEVEKRQKEEISQIKEENEKLLDEKEKELMKLKQEYETRLQQLKAEHESSIKRLTEKHQQELNDLKTKYQEQLNRAKRDQKQADEELKKMEEEKLELLSERERLSEDLNALKNKLRNNSKQKGVGGVEGEEREKLLQEIDELRSQIDLLQADMLVENNRLAEELLRIKDSSQDNELRLKLEIEFLRKERTESPSRCPNNEKILEKLVKLQQALDNEKQKAVKTALALQEERSQNSELKTRESRDRTRREKCVEEFERELLISTKQSADLKLLLDRCREDLALEKAAHSQTVEELRALKHVKVYGLPEVDKLRKELSARDDKHLIKLSELEEILKKEITRNEFLKCELERERSRGAELLSMLHEEQRDHDDTALEHSRALMCLPPHSSLSPLRPHSPSHSDLLITIHYLKEENLDLWDEVEFLRERAIYLESEQDRLSYSLESTSKNCRALESQGSSSKHQILLIQLSACRSRLLSVLQRIQAMTSRLQGLPQSSTFIYQTKDDYSMSLIDGLNTELDEVRIELRRLDSHSLDDLQTAGYRRTAMRQTQADRETQRPRSAGYSKQSSTFGSRSGRTDRHRQYLIFQKQYLQWTLAQSQSPPKQASPSKPVQQTTRYQYRATTYSKDFLRRKFRVAVWTVLAAVRLMEPVKLSTILSYYSHKSSTGTYHDELVRLKERERELLEEREKSEQEFSKQRATFMDMYKQKESELNEMREGSQKLEEQVRSLEGELSGARRELEDVRAVAALVEGGKVDEIDRVQRRYEEEVASLQKILKDRTSEVEEEAVNRYEREKEKLLTQQHQLRLEIQQLHNKLSQEREGFVTSITRVLQKKVANAISDDNLEDSMKKAQDDTEMLRSVVLPLEEEITNLKSQLQASNDELRVVRNLQMRELRESLEREKSSRTDLEMYVAVLSIQKDVLQTDSDRLRAQLTEVCNLLEKERMEHSDLKRTWQMANDQFLESQRLTMMDLRRVESVLTADQQKLISELKKEDVEREQMERRVRELEELREKEQREQERRRKSVEEKATVDRESHVTNNVSTESHPAADVHAVRTDVVDGAAVKNSESSVNHSNHDISLTCTLTQAQRKSLIDTTPDNEASETLLANARAFAESKPLVGTRLVSDREWLALQREVSAARDQVCKQCNMCATYQAKIRSLNEAEKKTATQIQALERHLEAERESHKNHEQYTKDLETSLRVRAEQCEEEISTLENKMKESEKFVSAVRLHFNQAHHELHQQLKSLRENRESLQVQLDKLQEENETLAGKHVLHSQQLQDESINFPNTVEEMQVMLLKCREDLIRSRVGEEHTSDTLKSEILFLKSQVLSEQQERATMEENLSRDISQLQEELAISQSVVSELERQKEKRLEEESQRARKELEENERKDKIEILQGHIAKCESDKARLEKELQEQKNKILSLQVDLDNSEVVQRDFVKLSQSLQIQLEKIRGSESEVRWQHEEDVDECTYCKQSFNVTRRKHHCRHCGQLFCIDCLGKTVKSGPNLRPSRVCDVCHTILVKDATPYFSSQPKALT